jgi:hypothetical protein
MRKKSRWSFFSKDADKSEAQVETFSDSKATTTARLPLIVEGKKKLTLAPIRDLQSSSQQWVTTSEAVI